MPYQPGSRTPPSARATIPCHFRIFHGSFKIACNKLTPANRYFGGAFPFFWYTIHSPLLEKDEMEDTAHE